MYTVTTYPHGTFSWADCISTDAEKAVSFYTALMGWQTQQVPMGPGQVYTFFMQDGQRAAAVGPMPPDTAQAGVTSHWANYVTVDAVDALVPQVTALGGTVVTPPMDVFDDGRMMVIQDPTGAAVSLWQPKGSIGAGIVNTVGAMSWNELSTREPDKAAAFYSALLGWTTEDDGTGYVVFKNQGRMNGGMMQMDDSYGDMPAHWLTYFSVADIDAVVAKVPTLGGKVHTEVISAEQAGRFAVISDPTGAVFTAIQPSGVVDPWLEHEA